VEAVPQTPSQVGKDIKIKAVYLEQVAEVKEHICSWS
jgi:hypothetical protein